MTTDMVHTDEQRMLVDTLRRFFQERRSLEERRALLSEAGPRRLGLWPELAEMGALGAFFDESCGGFAGDARTIAAVMVELGRSLAIEPVMASALIAGRILIAARDNDAAASTVSGERIYVLAHDSGVDPFAPPRLTLEQGCLNGTIRCVRHADLANEFLVSACEAGTIRIYRVPSGSVRIVPSRMIDGASAGDLIVENLRVADLHRLDVDGPQALHEALEWGLLALAAETLGLIELAANACFAFLATRKQFGVPIASFQALRHRAADMRIAVEELSAILEPAISAFDLPGRSVRTALASAAKALADSLGRQVGHEAIQMHGGMGVSDESEISHVARRLAAIRNEIGSADLHHLRFGASQDLAPLLSVNESDDSRSWREQVREFTHHHLPSEIRRKVATGTELSKQDIVGWQKVLRAHEWFAGAWPREAGGSNWDLEKQLVFAQESAVSGAPMVSPYGVKMLGPVIYTYGTDEQKKRHLPGILDSDVWWCQGYSEPGAGSDLASLKTFAERDGDHYVVNGSKMWTTEAHWADWMHCLVRTDRSGKPQSGITFLLIDMKSPGISIRPIVTIDGQHHTNSVFLDNVRVPIANRVGEEGRGWTFAKFLLGNERTSIADTGPKLRLLRTIQQANHALGCDIAPSLRSALDARLARASMRLLALCNMERRYVSGWAHGKPLADEASILKVRGTEVLQELAELGLEVQGVYGGVHCPSDLAPEAPDTAATPSRQASAMAHEYLYSRCWSIFGGTNEIQRNLIAQHVLQA